MFKKCSKCKEIKLTTDFYKDKYSKDGLTFQCKKCQKEHYQINKERICKRQKAYQQLHKENTNRNSRKWRLNHSKQFCKIVRNWEKNNPENCRHMKRKSNAKRHRNLGFIPLMSNPFPKEIPIDYHHITNTFVIPVPRQVHRKMCGKKHRVKVNDWIEQYIGLVGI